MASNDPTAAPVAEKTTGNTSGSEGINNGNAAQRYDYGHNPMAHVHTGQDARLPAFGGEFQPGLWKLPSPEHRKFANPAPLGLSAFALTTFVLSLVNLEARGVEAANIAVPLALGYGGLVQLLAGMWEMAVGNTFGATALSSYGGFWISYGILLSPAWDIKTVYDKAGGADDPAMWNSAVGFFLTGWFIFTTILLLCTLRSTVMFFLLFFTLDIAFLLLLCSDYAMNNGAKGIGTNLKKGGGVFGMFAAFLAWYNAFAGIADSSNSFFLIPVFHLPWSEKGREAKLAKTASQMA